MSGLFGSTPKPPPPPKPVPMPDPNDLGVKDAQLQQLLKARQRSGRASTVLSGEDAYSQSTTGTP